MRMHYTLDIMSCPVYCRMNDIAREVDSVFTFLKDIAIDIYLDQIWSSNFVVAQTEFIDQKLVVGSRDSARNVVIQ